MQITKTIRFGSLAGLVALGSLGGCDRPQRPNIIFFLIDDNGWTDSQVAYGEEAYPFNGRYDTPNMLRLAEKGVIMTSGYACPLSTPTRTALMTGMNAAHERITTYGALVRDTPTDAAGGTTGIINDNPDDPFGRSDWNWNGIQPEGVAIPGGKPVDHALTVTPLVRLLRDAGYHTIHVGKAHWAPAGTPGASPYNMGFTVNVAGSNAGYPRSYLSEENYGNTKELWQGNAVMNLTEYYGTGTHLSEALTLEAKKALAEPISRHQPFYLYMSHYGTHTPIQPDMRYYRKYRDRGMDDGQAKYASMCEGMDKSLGDLMDFLEEKGVADNTVIILYADNGGHSIDARKGGVPHTQNAPLREGKGSVYEGGIREPLLVYVPGKTVGGMRINTPVGPEDFFPTILEMAGIQGYKTIQPVDGESFYRLVTEGSRYVARAVADGRIASQKEANRFQVPASVSGLDPLRPIISHMPHQWRIEDQPEIDWMSAVRSGPWKLVYRMHNVLQIPALPGDCDALQAAISAGVFELYNLDEDISEQHDLAASMPGKVADLVRLLGGRLRAWDANMPVIRATGAPVPFPDELLGGLAEFVD